jgi:hypothetical protein
MHRVVLCVFDFAFHFSKQKKMRVEISKSSHPKKKWKAVSGGKTIRFGQTGYEDFTQHNDPKRRLNYLSRHGSEDWSRSNIMSPAFMSRWILWEKPSKKAALANLNRKYKGVKFTMQ